MSDTLVPRIPVGQWADSAVDWLTSTFSGLFAVIKTVLLSCYDGLDWVLSSPPMWLVALVLSSLALLAKGWKLALGSLVGFTLIAGVGQWGNAMDTLSLVIVSTVIALLGGIPLGIWAARNRTVSNVLRPILDFMQTMPAFVYLIPTVVIFLSGPVPGIVASIIFALAPGARFTELGIRQVDKEVVEAGKAFGASDRRILRQIQVPLALPTIMAGVNQVIMLSLSMVVMAGLAGAGGLGGQVVAGLQRIDVGLGFEAGLSVVILAIFLDRVTSALSARSPVAKALAATNV
ncbi:MAG: ABC transporter permease [Cellulomonadaceae bacterium]